MSLEEYVVEITDVFKEYSMGLQVTQFNISYPTDWSNEPLPFTYALTALVQGGKISLYLGEAESRWDQVEVEL